MSAAMAEGKERTASPTESGETESRPYTAEKADPYLLAAGKLGRQAAAR